MSVLPLIACSKESGAQIPLQKALGSWRISLDKDTHLHPHEEKVTRLNSPAASNQSRKLEANVRLSFIISNSKGSTLSRVPVKTKYVYEFLTHLDSCLKFQDSTFRFLTGTYVALFLQNITDCTKPRLKLRQAQSDVGRDPQTLDKFTK